MANELKTVSTTSLGTWNNWAVGEITSDFTAHDIELDPYAKQCGMSAMSSIWTLIQSTDNFDLNAADTSNLRDMVIRCASLKLNASADPQEVYFQVRNKKVGGSWSKTVEMVVTTHGYESLLRNYGNDVAEVVGPMVVREGDDFTPPRYVGFKSEPPIWSPQYKSNKATHVLYMVKLKSGAEQYLISTRESVKTNLRAHVRNNMLNETFGICADRYKATAEQKSQISQKKEEIMAKLNACETLDDMLACKEARPYMSAAWLDSTEDMIVTKMIKNAVKKFPKNYNDIGKESVNRIEIESDNAYQVSQEEVAEIENSQEFLVDAAVEEVTGE